MSEYRGIRSYLNSFDFALLLVTHVRPTTLSVNSALSTRCKEIPWCEQAFRTRPPLPPPQRLIWRTKHFIVVCASFSDSYPPFQQTNKGVSPNAGGGLFDHMVHQLGWEYGMLNMCGRWFSRTSLLLDESTRKRSVQVETQGRHTSHDEPCVTVARSS